MADPAYEAMSKAKRQVESGNPEGAERTLEDYLATDPHNTKPRMMLAQLWANELGDKNNALMQLDIVLDLEPNNMDALKAMVLMLRVDKKQIKAADEIYQRLLSNFPEDTELLKSFAIFQRKQLLDYKGAQETYERALALAPNDPDLHYNYSLLLVKEMKDYVKARHHLETAVKLDPNNYNAQKGLAILMKKRFKNDLPKKKLFGR